MSSLNQYLEFVVKNKHIFDQYLEVAVKNEHTFDLTVGGEQRRRQRKSNDNRGDEKKNKNIKDEDIFFLRFK